MLEAAYRVPRATLCLGAVLVRHGLSDAIWIGSTWRYFAAVGSQHYRASRCGLARPNLGTHKTLTD
jgi:hypothetical protein